MGDEEEQQKVKELDNMVIRIYDARYKIPASSDAG
jgi:hypothetical protein